MNYLIQSIKDRLGVGTQSVRSTEEHLTAAAEWLLRSQQATPDDGVPHSYDLRERQWLPSYPETTGYIIPTFYNYARHFGAPRFADAARRMAVWEVEIQLPDGGVRAGDMGAEVCVPTIFNTGQVIFGWARAFEETQDESFRKALVKAADWLVDAQDPDGAWRRFPSPFSGTSVNSFNTRTAFAMLRAYQVTGDQRYLDSANANINWAISQSGPKCWLPHNCLTSNPDDRALSHTIAYSIHGILEVGCATGNQLHVNHAVRMAETLAQTQRSDGALAGYYNPEWKPVTSWTCITGNSQMAVNWLRLSQITSRTDFIEHAVRANRFNMSVQNLSTSDPNIRGALKGSHPIDGSYMTYRYPSWAAKFFMDALMLERSMQERDHAC